MRKIALLIVFLTIIALTSFAEGGATVKVTGAIKAQWGMDIDNSTTGFKYVVDGLEVVMKPAVEAGEAKKTGAEGETVYGEIKMGGLRLEADSGWGGMTDYSSAAVNMKWDELSAKVVLGPLTIMLKNGAGTTINYEGAKANSFWLTNAYDYAVFSKRYGADDGSNSAATANSWEGWNQIQFVTPGNYFSQTTNYGIVAKYSVPSVVDLGLDLASFKAWDSIAIYDAVANDNDNAYAARVTASVTAVPNLTLNLGASFGFNYATADAKDAALGAKLSYAIALGEGMSLTPGVALDMALPATDQPISVTGGVKLVVAKSTITANVGYDLSTDSLAYTIAAMIGAIDGLTLNAAYEAIDADTTVTGDDTMAVHAKLGYGIKVDDKVTVTPSFQMSMDNKADLAGEEADDNVNDLFAKVAVDITGAIPNTTLSLNWDSNDFQNTTAGAQTMGQFVVTTKISF